MAKTEGTEFKLSPQAECLKQGKKLYMPFEVKKAHCAMVVTPTDSEAQWMLEQPGFMFVCTTNGIAAVGQ